MIVTNGLETKNSEVVAFNVDPISKVVALASYISPTPIPTVTPTPKVTSSNTTLTVVFVILIILLVITAIGFFIVSRKKKKQTNKSVEHMKKAMDGMPVEETEEEKATRKISSLGDN